MTATPTHITGTAEAWRMWCAREYRDTFQQTFNRRRALYVELMARQRRLRRARVDG